MEKDDDLLNGQACCPAILLTLIRIWKQKTNLVVNIALKISIEEPHIDFLSPWYHLL